MRLPRNIATILLIFSLGVPSRGAERVPTDPCRLMLQGWELVPEEARRATNDLHHVAPIVRLDGLSQPPEDWFEPTAERFRYTLYDSNETPDIGKSPAASHVLRQVFSSVYTGYRGYQQGDVAKSFVDFLTGNGRPLAKILKTQPQDDPFGWFRWHMRGFVVAGVPSLLTMIYFTPDILQYKFPLLAVVLGGAVAGGGVVVGSYKLGILAGRLWNWAKTLRARRAIDQNIRSAIATHRTLPDSSIKYFQLMKDATHSFVLDKTNAAWTPSRVFLYDVLDTETWNHSTLLLSTGPRGIELGYYGWKENRPLERPKFKLVPVEDGPKPDTWELLLNLAGDDQTLSTGEFHELRMLIAKLRDIDDPAGKSKLASELNDVGPDVVLHKVKAYVKARLDRENR